MSGFEDLNQHQKRAISALLSGKTRKDASDSAGINERTLRRWFSDDADFRRTYRDLCDAAFMDGMSSLKGRVDVAVDVLTEALEARDVSTRVRAANALLTHAARAYDEGIEDEIAELRRRVEEAERRGRRGRQ